jgi:hypothetical protein
MIAHFFASASKLGHFGKSTIGMHRPFFLYSVSFIWLDANAVVHCPLQTLFAAQISFCSFY